MVARAEWMQAMDTRLGTRGDVRQRRRGLAWPANSIVPPVVVGVLGLQAHEVAALKSALEIVRPGGQITKVGWGPQPLGFSLDPLVQKAVRLQGSFSHTFENWEMVVSMLASGQINLKPIISRIAHLEDWQDCFDGMHGGKYVKAVLQPK